LLMVILISRWFRIFNTRRLFYGWFISNSRTYTNSYVMGYDDLCWLCQRKLNFECCSRQWLLFVPRAWCTTKLLLYNILKRNTIEGGLQSGGNLKIVLIVLLYNKMGYFRPIITT
jgi:hypothetical protein